jgi:hypothetical protein
VTETTFEPGQLVTYYSNGWHYGRVSEQKKELVRIRDHRGREVKIGCEDVREVNE